jgi:hypothetical protein
LGLAYGGEEAEYIVKAIGMMVHTQHGTGVRTEPLTMANSEVAVSGRYIIKPRVVAVNASDIVESMGDLPVADGGGHRKPHNCAHGNDWRGRGGVAGYYDPDCYMKEVCVPREG